MLKVKNRRTVSYDICTKGDTAFITQKGNKKLLIFFQTCFSNFFFWSKIKSKLIPKQSLTHNFGFQETASTTALSIKYITVFKIFPRHTHTHTSNSYSVKSYTVLQKSSTFLPWSPKWMRIITTAPLPLVFPHQPEPPTNPEFLQVSKGLVANSQILQPP